MSNYIRNSEEEVKEYQRRYRLIYIVIAVSSLIIFCRLWYLQIIQGQELRTYSERNRVKETKIPSPRGFILDRNGEVLVHNLQGFNISISPQYAKKLEETAASVGPIIGLESEKVIEMVNISKRQNGHFRPAIIKENLSLDEVYRLKLLRFDHPGLNINETILRHYPLKNIGAQLFGYVGEISKSQIDRFNDKYSDENIRFEQGDIIGKNGLEEVWETRIRGQSGISYVEVDARGRETTTDTPSFLGLEKQSSIPGYNLVLTIDKDLQLAAAKAMARDDKVGPRVGSVVAIKNNGEVLAWYSSPSFDPNEFSKGISRELWSTLINDPFKPLRNKTIQDHYAPGSTFKPIVALAALQEGVIKASTKIFSPSAIKFGRRTYHDHSKVGYGNIDVLEAIERSSNVFFYKMGIKLEIDNIHKYSALLGIGEKTYINLPNEVPGLMPNKDWKLKNYGEEWQPGENLSNAIGQGFVLTTPLQMALAYNAIGTEGKLYKPMLVKQLINRENEVVEEYKPQLVRDVSINNEDGTPYIEKRHFKTVTEGMRRVSNGARGTARWWKIPGVQIAGKTGTSQVRSFSADQIYEKCNERPVQDRHHGWFVGFAPAKKPEITVAVLAEHACAGSSGGAPVVRDIIFEYMKKYHPEKLKTAKKKKAAPKEEVTE